MSPSPPSHQQSSTGQGAGGSSSGGGHHGSKIGSEEGSECNSSITSESVPGGSTTLAHLASPRNHHSQVRQLARLWCVLDWIFQPFLPTHYQRVSCVVLQLTGVDFFGQPGGVSVEQLLMELRESREEIARLREEIDSTKVSCIVVVWWCVFWLCLVWCCE